MSSHKDAALRVNYAFKIINNLWNRNEIRNDLVSEYAAAQVWVWAPTCYSLLEQALKLLRATRKGIEPSKIKSEIEKLPGGKRGLHDLEFLFGIQEPKDQAILSSAFRSCRQLHDYITFETLPAFLVSIGRGYTVWRYMLIEGIEQLPPSHIDTMIELAGAAAQTLMHEHYPNQLYRNIEVRIHEYLNQAVFKSATLEYAHNYPELDSADEYMVHFKDVLRRTCQIVERNPVLVSRFLDFARETANSKAVPRNEIEQRIALICSDLPPNERKHLRQYFFKLTPRGRLNLSRKQMASLPISIHVAKVVLDRAARSDSVSGCKRMRILEAERRIRDLDSDSLSLDEAAKRGIDRLAALSETEEIQWDEVDAAIDQLNGPAER